MLGAPSLIWRRCGATAEDGIALSVVVGRIAFNPSAPVNRHRPASFGMSLRVPILGAPSVPAKVGRLCGGWRQRRRAGRDLIALALQFDRQPVPFQPSPTVTEPAQFPTYRAESVELGGASVATDAAL
jgi:hypothetical protein